VAAGDVLVAVARKRRTLGAQLDRTRQQFGDERDRALLLELTTGVCRWRAAIDTLLEPCCNRPLSAVDEFTLAALRVAMYQLRWLDRVPAHAAVHAAVNAARERAGDRAAGFVNAVLRGYLRRSPLPALPERPGPGASRRQRLTYLSTTLSHPMWLVARWLDRYGFEPTEAWCRFNITVPDLSVRATRPATDLRAAFEAAGIEVVASPHAPDVLRLQRGAWSRLPPEVRDALLIQDEASALVAGDVAAHPGERVLDLCAAPGGKSVLLWEAMQHTGTLVTADRRTARLHVLRQALRAAEVPVLTVQVDATQPLPFDATFDRVFVDAPCSGLGTLRRDPDIKWHVTLEDLPRLADTQRAMLDQAAAVVKPGGVLVYATCSSEPEENEHVVHAFLEQHQEFRLDPIPSGGDEDGFRRTRPDRDGLDAFFAARLIRARG
jgi:16S rRNA (cytosine967-C5)-methyltransferase